MKICPLWIAPVVVLVYGCGGSGGGSSGKGNTTHVQQFGPVTASFSGATKGAVTIPSRSAVFTGVFGASFSEVKVRMPPITSLNVSEVLGQTQIGYSKSQNVYLYDYATGKNTRLGDLAGWGGDAMPSISGVGNRVAFRYFDSSINSQIFSMAMDGTDLRQLTSGTVWSYYPSYSPDGNKVLFDRTDPAASSHWRIYSVPWNGGTAIPLTPAEDNCLHAKWSPDGSKIAFFRQVAATGNWIPTLMNRDGTEISAMPGGIAGAGAGFIDWLPNSGLQYVESVYTGSGYQLWVVNPTASSYVIVNTTDYIGRVSTAPAGAFVAYERGGTNYGVYLRDIVSATDYYIASGSSSPTWGPYSVVRNVIGTVGPMGRSAGGFLFGLLDSRIRSFMTFDATTRSSLNVLKGDATGTQTDVTCTISGDSVTSLRYLNDFRSAPVTIATAAQPISGAIVAFSADTGEVSAVIPYKGASPSRKPTSRSSESTIIYSGGFTSVWNAEGKNQAPSGATEVTIDGRTGKVLSVH